MHHVMRLQFKKARAVASIGLLAYLFAYAGMARGDASATAYAPLQGTWVVVAAEQGSKPFDAIKNGRLAISGETFNLETANGNHLDGRLKLNDAVKQNQLDFQLSNGELWIAVYTVDNTTFRLNYVESDGTAKRPTDFTTTANMSETVIVMRKADATQQ